MIYTTTFGPLLENVKKQEIQDIKNIFTSKACFQHNIAYGGFKYLAIRATFDKSSCGKTFDIARNLK